VYNNLLLLSHFSVHCTVVLQNKHLICETFSAVPGIGVARRGHRKGNDVIFEASTRNMTILCDWITSSDRWWL